MGSSAELISEVKDVTWYLEIFRQERAKAKRVGPGRFYRIKNSPMIVEIVRQIESTASERWWWTKRVLAGDHFACGETIIGDELTDMEVIAWAAR